MEYRDESRRGVSVLRQLRVAVFLFIGLFCTAWGIPQRVPAKAQRPTFWIAYDRIDTSEYGMTNFPHTDIFVMDINGRHSRRLTSNHRGHNPSWSPNGSNIAFLAEQRSPVAPNTTDESFNIFVEYRDLPSIPRELFVMDADGRNSACISSVGNGARDIVWFADGKLLGVRVLDLGALRVLADKSGVLSPDSLKPETLNEYLAHGTPQPVGADFVDYWTLLEWLPPVDNFMPTSVASRAFEGYSNPGLIKTVPSSGDLTQSLRVVSTDGAVEIFPVTAYDLAWAPDGKSIAYSAFSTGGNSILYVGHAVDDYVARHPLTEQALEAHGPTWSSDGSRIAFMGLWKETSQIFVIGADGGSLTQLGRDAKLSCFHPSWSPDGKWIVAACRRSITVMRPLTSELGGLSSIYLFEVGKPGAKPRQLTRCAPTDELPSPTCGARNPSFAPSSAPVEPVR